MRVTPSFPFCCFFVSLPSTPLPSVLRHSHSPTLIPPCHPPRLVLSIVIYLFYLPFRQWDDLLSSCRLCGPQGRGKTGWFKTLRCHTHTCAHLSSHANTNTQTSLCFMFTCIFPKWISMKRYQTQTAGRAPIKQYQLNNISLRFFYNIWKVVW